MSRRVLRASPCGQYGPSGFSVGTRPDGRWDESLQGKMDRSSCPSCRLIPLKHTDTLKTLGFPLREGPTKNPDGPSISRSEQHWTRDSAMMH